MLEGGGKLVDAVVPRFERAAIAFSGKVNRIFVLEPSDEENGFDFGRFSIAGRGRVVAKVNDTEEAARRFRAFRPT